ncbi:hypothetical protein [Phenylobacterium sp.]|nr:hypothetical protein [Phenylobacterium sp.]
MATPPSIAASYQEPDKSWRHMDYRVNLTIDEVEAFKPKDGDTQ